MNDAGSLYPAPVPLPLLDAVNATGSTLLGFFREYLSAAMPFLVFEKRTRGLIPRLSPAHEAAIANALIAANAPAPAANAPAQASFLTWSNGDGWRTSEPPFNIFPIPVSPVVAPSSLTLPDGPTTTYFSYVQATPSATWTITHNLGRNPSVNAFDTDDKPILGTVTYLSPNQVLVVFPAPIAGFAYLA